MKDKQTDKKSSHSTVYVQFAIVLFFAALSSWQLFYHWSRNRVEGNSWILFIIWLLPLLRYRFTCIKERIFGEWNFPLLYASIVLTFLGIIGSLNTLCYIGMALSLMSPLPPLKGVYLWGITSILWMPASAWVGLWYFPSYYFLARVVLLAICSVGLTYLLQQPLQRSLKHEQ